VSDGTVVAGGVPGGPAATFADAVRSEWTKFRTVRSTGYTLAAVVVLAFGFAVVYCIIVFGNVGFPCVPGADPHWCSDMTKDSAAEGSATLLLFPLSFVLPSYAL